MEIVVMIGSLVLVGGSIQFFIRKSNNRDKENLNKDWNAFLEAANKSDIKGITFYGDKLVWNKHLRQVHLTKLQKIAEAYVDNHPELEKLRLNVMNKQLHYNRTLDAGPGW